MGNLFCLRSDYQPEAWTKGCCQQTQNHSKQFNACGCNKMGLLMLDQKIYMKRPKSVMNSQTQQTSTELQSSFSQQNGLLRSISKIELSKQNQRSSSLLLILSQDYTQFEIDRKQKLMRISKLLPKINQLQIQQSSKINFNKFESAFEEENQSQQKITKQNKIISHEMPFRGKDNEQGRRLSVNKESIQRRVTIQNNKLKQLQYEHQ